MGITKSQLFTREQNDLAAIAKAFAHPAKIAILQHLLKANTCINSHLVKETGLAQPTVSRHLKDLKDAGLIDGTIEGTSVCYCISPARWNEVKALFNELFDQLPQMQSHCC